MAKSEVERVAPRIFTPDYYERMRVLESTSWWNAGMRDVAWMLLSLVTLPTRGQMLDVGCGSGQTMSWFSSLQPHWRTLGLDVAPEGLAAARAIGLRTVLRASALDLPIPTASVDLVMTLDVLQHLPLDGGDARALDEIARVLKPGGYLFLRTNSQSLPRAADDPSYQFHKYDAAELRTSLRNAGFRVLVLGRMNALLGFSEIPRELRARSADHSYHGLLSEPRGEPRWSAELKRAWLRFEGRLVRSGLSLPLGRTIVALCQR